VQLAISGPCPIFLEVGSRPFPSRRPFNRPGRQGSRIKLSFRYMSGIWGKVVGGRADFGRWIERLSSLYERKTGMRLYPGTLNIELPGPYSLPRDVIRLEAEEYGGRVSVSIVPCRIFDRRAFFCAQIRTNEASDITREILSRSLPTFGCGMSINSKMEIGWK
jgi:hypothetical protein